MNVGFRSQFQMGLRQSKLRDGDPCWSRRDKVDAERRKELDGARISTVFTADANCDRGVGLACVENGHLHQLTDTFLVKDEKWIIFQDSQLQVLVEILAGIIPRETEGHLRKVIRPEGKEI